jgi:cryptochrome
MDLDGQLRKRGSRLIVLRGTPEETWEKVFKDGHPFKARTLLWEQDTTPYARKRDTVVENIAERYGVTVETFPGHTLLNVSAVVATAGFKAPTTNPGIEKMVSAYNIAKPLPIPEIPALKQEICGFEMFTLQEIGYTSAPSHIMRGGEQEGLKVLDRVCGNAKYVCSFDKTKTSSTTGPAPEALSTTGLSPYLMCGAVSVRTIYHTVRSVLSQGQHTKAPVSLLGQLYFREMFYLMGASTPNFDQVEGNPRCLDVAWSEKPEFVKAWEEGRTGYPYIDGLMRQLAETGWIHHLGRHAVACFLTRGDLWQSWTHGRDVFHKLLIDADGCLNNGNWMALAGVAPWSPPWFRIYSPIPNAKSSLNVDMDGAWLKRFVPELRNMPEKYLFSPWTAPKAVQEQAKCIIGRDYPAPIVDHAEASKANLAKFKASVDRAKGLKTANAAAQPKTPSAAAAPKKQQRLFESSAVKQPPKKQQKIC